MYPLHCFSPYNKGKACSRDSVSHSCNSLTFKGKNCVPVHSFSPYNKGKNCVPLHSFDANLNCILNCNLGTTASQEGLHLEKTVYPYTLLTAQYTVFKRKKAYSRDTYIILHCSTVLSHIMAYSSMPYVGMALKKMAATLRVHK